MSIDFNQLPATVQNAILAENTHHNEGDYDGVKFYVSQSQNHQGLWAVPSLCYDFHESNFSVILVNLEVVWSIDVGPAMAEMVAKLDVNETAWIIIDPSEGDTDFQIIECVV